jgi:hypothetical protein
VKDRETDPIGPLSFALDLQRPFEDIAREFPEVRVIAYLDDVYLQGTADKVEQTFLCLNERCKSKGLDMAPD